MGMENIPDREETRWGNEGDGEEQTVCLDVMLLTHHVWPVISQLVSVECTLLFALWCLTCHINVIGPSFFIYKIYEKVWFLILEYFLAMLGTGPLCFILGSLWSFIFTQNFFTLGIFFLHCVLTQRSHLLHPWSESLKYILYNILTCWKKTNLKGFFVSLWFFVYCLLPMMRTFHLFSCWVAFRYPIDYYKRKMDQVISNVNFKELMYVLYFLVFFCKICAYY